MDTTYAVGKHKRFVFGSTVLPRASSSCHLDPPTCQIHAPQAWLESGRNEKKNISISGLVVEYIVAIDVTQVRFPADAYLQPGDLAKSPGDLEFSTCMMQ